VDGDIKKFQRDIKLLDKDMRTWNAYVQLEQVLKNMITSLRSITELQNAAIRDRHWDELMFCTNVQFSMSSQTTLEDLLKLNLYNFEDEVRNIVDKAVKEMSMEKTIKDIENVWTTMEFSTDPHPRTGIHMLIANDKLIEALEDHQVQLQNMLQSKYIAFFQNQVSTWQKRLSHADQMIQILREVQKTWAHLESIFIGTEDIRTQLPDDSKLFDQIDVDFKKIAQENQQDLNVIRCTNRDNVYERLESIKNRLARCEKALAEYLETKRLTFPRFVRVHVT
jgi:dynein heavy chain, axonemal